MDISNEVTDNIKKLINGGLEKKLEQGVTKACLVIERSAKENCPVDKGRLRQSITHKVKGTKGSVGTNVEYAPYVEIGTGIYSSNGDGRDDAWEYKDSKGDWHKTKGQKPQPFLKPAATNNFNKILDAFKGVIDD